VLLHLDNDVVCDHLASLDTKDFLRSITYYLKTTGAQEKGQTAKSSVSKIPISKIPITAAEPPSWIDTLNDRYDLYGSSYIGALYSIGWFRPIAQRVLGDCDLLDIDGYGNNCMEDVSTTGARIVNAEIAVALLHESSAKNIELIQRIDRWCWTKIMFTAPYRFQAAGEERDSCRLAFLETILVKINSTRQMAAYMLHYLPCEIILDRIQLNYKIPTRFERMSKSKNMRFLYQYYETLQTTKEPWHN
jgi:hypothetical protein